MNHQEKLQAVQYLTKQAWDNDAWYSYIPVIGDAGNAINNFRQGNIVSGLGNIGLGALNFIPGLGTAAGLALKGGGRLAGAAARGVTAAGKVAPKLTKNLPSPNVVRNTVQDGVESAGKAMNKGFNRGVNTLEKIPGGKFLSSGMRNRPGAYLAGTTALNVGSKALTNYLGSGNQGPGQAGGFQMPNLNLGGRGQGGGLMAGTKGQMEGFESASGL